MAKTDPRIPPYMVAALRHYEADGARRLQEFIGEVEAKTAPRLPYHYTNDTGLAGIVKAGSYAFQTSSP